MLYFQIVVLESFASMIEALLTMSTASGRDHVSVEPLDLARRDFPSRASRASGASQSPAPD